jgi:uncharacterized protein (DUF433 family)
MSPLSQAAPQYPHIDVDANGAPALSGTTMKVVELVQAQQAHGWSPEELHFQFPHLPLGHIHSALAYYWDHKQELDEDMDRRDRQAEAIRAETEPGAAALISKLRARKAGA